MKIWFKKKWQIALLVVAAFIVISLVVKVPFYIEGDGNIMAEKDAVVRSSVKAAIMDIFVESGDRVKEGELLIQLEDTAEQAEVAVGLNTLKEAEVELKLLTSQIEYDLKSQELQGRVAKIELEDALREYSMLKELFDKKAASQNEVQKAYFAWKLAEARLEMVSVDKRDLFSKKIELQERKIDTLRARLEYARSQLERRKIRAPISGVVVLHTLSKGQVVDANQVLGQIFSEGSYYIVARVPERYLWFLKKGRRVIAETSSYPHRAFGYIQASLSWVSPVVNPHESGDGAVIIKARVEAVPSGVVLKPGQSARIWIEGGKVSVLEYLIGVRPFEKEDKK